MMTNRIARRSSALAMLLAAGMAFPHGGVAFSQGLDAEGAIDTIVGTDVGEEKTEARAEPERVIAAIGMAEESAATVRKTTILDKLDILYVADAAIAEGGPPADVQDALDTNRQAITDLRAELEGNAMLYHAVNSRQVLMRDVLAVEFDDRHVTIFVAAPEPRR